MLIRHHKDSLLAGVAMIDLVLIAVLIACFLKYPCTKIPTCSTCKQAEHSIWCISFHWAQNY